MTHFFKARKEIFLVLGAAGLLFFSLPGSPAENGLLAWIGLVPLFMAMEGATPRRAALLGLIWGMFYFPSMLYWIIIVLSTYGHLSLFLAIPGLLLLSLYMSLYPALFAFLLTRMKREGSIILLAPVLWVSLDLIRARIFTGFPWQDLAYSQYRFPRLLQVCDLTGHYGLTFLIVMTNALLFYLFCRGRAASLAPGTFRQSLCRQAFVALALLLVSQVYNFWRYQEVEERLKTASPFTVAVIQGNVDQNEKWLPSMQRRTVSDYIRLSEQAMQERRVDLLLWPETSLPFYPETSPLFPELIEQLVKPARVNLLAGAPHFTPAAAGIKEQYFNSAFFISRAGTVEDIYHKQHLVPFGEYIPLRSVLRLPGPLVENIGDFSPGTSSRPITCENGKLGVLICYESIFPELARKLAVNGANLLVNLTNDAWYGRSSAPWQQLSMALLRAVENRKSLARAANTGISTTIDPLGRCSSLSPLFEPFQATAVVPLLSAQTVFTRFGYLFAPACLLISLLLLILSRKRKSVADFRSRI